MMAVASAQIVRNFMSHEGRLRFDRVKVFYRVFYDPSDESSSFHASGSGERPKSSGN